MKEELEAFIKKAEENNTHGELQELMYNYLSECCISMNIDTTYSNNHPDYSIKFERAEWYKLSEQ